MFLSILSFLIGIIVVQQFSVLPEIHWFITLCFLGLLFKRYCQWRLMFFTIGLLWAICFATYRIADRLPEYLEGQLLQVEGQVIGLPHKGERRSRFDFTVLKSSVQLPEKIRLSWFFPQQEIKAGQYWKLTIKLKKPHGRFNPGGFDYEQWLLIQNIGATGYVRNNPNPELLASPSTWKSFNNLRQSISDKLDSLLPESENLGVIKALTIGDRHGINDKQWNVFRETGTIHLLAISGLHIGLISSLVYFVMFKIAIKFSVISPQKIAAISAVVFALFYSALAGFSIPTQRALIMLVIVMATLTIQRNVLVKNTIVLAVLGVVLIDPFAVLSAGFWLSFLAVSVIVFSLSGRLAKPGYWVGITKIHCVTALGLAPLLLFYFQQFSIIAPIANFIAVPVVSLMIVPLCFVAVILLFVSVDLAGGLLLIIDECLTVLWHVLSTLAAVPYASLALYSPPIYALFVFLGTLILFLPRGIPARWLGAVFLLPIFFVEQNKPNIADVEMTLLDVGQGLSAVIQTTNHTLVFDTGAKYSEKFDMGKSVVIPFLQHKGLETVDTLLISHADNDHIGGAQSIVDQVGAEEIITSVPELQNKYHAVQCQTGIKWIWDQVNFEILSPTLGVLSGENNNSCVLKVSTKNSSILLTGDIEKEAESWLVEQQGIVLKSDVLIAPHHGSKTSSSMAFLKAVNPKIILIPAGYKNRFSFPHEEVINRYIALNKTWMNTASDGAISIKLNNEGYSVNSERVLNGRYWN